MAMVFTVTDRRHVSALLKRCKSKCISICMCMCNSNIVELLGLMFNRALVGRVRRTAPTTKFMM